MRTLLLFTIAAAAQASAGCAACLVGSGRNLQDLQNQSEVHEVFGSPVIAGEANGQAFEEFVTRRKIAEPWRVSPGMAMMYPMTLGLGEIVILPTELFRTGKRTLLGQQLRFTYDAEGDVTSIQWDGEPVSLPPRFEIQPVNQ